MLGAGTTIEEVQNRQRRLDASTQLRFLELAANELHDDWFGFRLAQDFELGESDYCTTLLRHQSGSPML
jgi:hypothetical protein